MNIFQAAKKGVSNMANNLIISEIERKIDQYIGMEAPFLGLMPSDIELVIDLNVNHTPQYYIRDKNKKKLSDFNLDDLRISNNHAHEIEHKIAQYILSKSASDKVILVISSDEKNKQKYQIEDIFGNIKNDFKVKDLLNDLN